LNIVRLIGVDEVPASCNRALHEEVNVKRRK
jgi:hypothetical protein